MRSRLRDTLSVLLLIFMSLTPSDAFAAKAQLVSQDDTPVVLRGWPSAINWRFYELGWTPNYSSERWAVTGQAGYRQMKNTTYMFISRSAAGFYMAGGYPDDIRESYWFTQEKGYFQKFSDAEWESGQRFECGGDTVCKFRNLKFTARNETCQWVLDNTDMDSSIGSGGKTSEHWTVLIIHCGDTKPFTERHFDRTSETIKIRFPGSRADYGKGKEAEASTPTPKPKISSLEKAKKKCAEIGFTQGTEKFGDCVMKLVN